MRSGTIRKEGPLIDRKTADALLKEHPTYIPLEKAAKLLGVSARQLSRLVAEGREPFASIGANIGTKQNYIRIYTMRLIAYLNGELPME